MRGVSNYHLGMKNGLVPPSSLKFMLIKLDFRKNHKKIPERGITAFFGKCPYMLKTAKSKERPIKSRGLHGL